MERRSKMQISQVSYSLRQMAAAMVSGGLSKQPEYDEREFDERVGDCEESLAHGWWTSNRDVLRTLRLSRMPANSGHANVMTGLTVFFNVTATNVWMLQAERYHFMQLVTSQSKMHRISQMVASPDVASRFHQKVSPEVVEWFVKWQEGRSLEEKVYNCPMGLELTASVSTNYLQLRTIYLQRHDHPLQEWRDFCAVMVASLPLGKELIAGDLTAAEGLL